MRDKHQIPHALKFARDVMHFRVSHSTQDKDPILNHQSVFILRHTDWITPIFAQTAMHEGRQETNKPIAVDDSGQRSSQSE